MVGGIGQIDVTQFVAPNESRIIRIDSVGKLDSIPASFASDHVEGDPSAPVAAFRPDTKPTLNDLVPVAQVRGEANQVHLSVDSIHSCWQGEFRPALVSVSEAFLMRPDGIIRKPEGFATLAALEMEQPVQPCSLEPVGEIGEDGIAPRELPEAGGVGRRTGVGIEEKCPTMLAPEKPELRFPSLSRGFGLLSNCGEFRSLARKYRKLPNVSRNATLRRNWRCLQMESLLVSAGFNSPYPAPRCWNTAYSTYHNTSSLNYADCKQIGQGEVHHNRGSILGSAVVYITAFSTNLAGECPSKSRGCRPPLAFHFSEAGIRWHQSYRPRGHRVPRETLPPLWLSPTRWLLVGSPCGAGCADQTQAYPACRVAAPFSLASLTSGGSLTSAAVMYPLISNQQVVVKYPRECLGFLPLYGAVSPLCHHSTWLSAGNGTQGIHHTPEI